MAKDPYRYFRIEAHELVDGLGQGLLELEKGPDPELVRRLLRLAHTFKGASRVVRRGEIGDLAHELEDLLSPHRDSTAPVQRATVDAALALLDRIRGHVAALDAAPGPPASEQRAVRDAQDEPPIVREDGRSVRIAIAELDALLESAGEAHSAASSLQRGAEQLGHVCAQVRSLLTSSTTTTATVRGLVEAERAAAELDETQRTISDRLDRLLGEVDELRGLASDLRLVPAQILLGDIERAARDAARSLDKDVEVRSQGADTHMDAHVLAGLRTALLHVVRNAVAHGIEDRAARERAGKPPVGRIDIEFERRGHRVSIRCRDDGRGLDLESVREAASKRALVGREQVRSMDAHALGQLLLAGGVSTTRVVNGVSGRGVGLDAVRHAVEALDGEVALRSTPGAGVSVDLLVPISLSAMPALPLYVDDAALLVPLDSVRKAVRVPDDAIARDSDGERIVVDGSVVPFLPLSRVLAKPRRAAGGMQSAVILEAEGRLAAIGVDRLGGARSIVVRGLPEHAAADPAISGATFDDDGVPQLVLAPAVLVRAASLAVHSDERPAARELAPVLVIDDSLTTRMLEQSILESAGYEVDLAVSAEEGLEKARQRRYGMYIVDVEMPGMNGFEFIATARADPMLRDTPAILVTSRADLDDKRRGREVGARAYIVKSEFDQADLLATVRRWVG